MACGRADCKKKMNKKKPENGGKRKQKDRKRLKREWKNRGKLETHKIGEMSGTESMIRFFVFCHFRWTDRFVKEILSLTFMPDATAALDLTKGRQILS